MTLSTGIAWAHELGEHALPGFFIVLAALLVGTALSWRGLRHVVVPHEESRLSPPAFLAVRLAVGFAVVVAAAMVFAELGGILNADDRLGRIDQALSDAIRDTVSLHTLQVFAWVTRFGDVATVALLGTVVALFLLVNERRPMALAWVFTLIGNAALNLVLKAVFARVRPLHDHGLVYADGFSFPSGHSSGSVVAYGMLAYLLVRQLPPPWHLPVVLTATAAAFTIGCSRVFLQVHFASDVIAGFASGLAWLVVCITSVELMRHYRRTRSSPSLLN
jgi:undecaprenyl-diphosphatase